ncbi:plastocyanin/azurin family copper-binding protein [Methanofollis fontis]|uniref:Blue (type 1) copper domain-containing protein n=1 Tax=Methanofollis fontis TaxID=2052832 RepID=A0A483CRV4_9EURY|nr:plastocyanin/azurin family copper-binding protein [Methanofollis fontis]TAJ43860.1 hypothetical protein CUJ86_07280 [Methanofollis fontis]
MHAGRCIPFIILLAVCLSGCTGGDGSPPPPVETTQVPITGEVTEIDLVAEQFAFDRTEITVPAGSTVVIRFENRDPGVGHNFALYLDETAQTVLFKGDLITGPSTTTYTFTAPETAGTYHFLCDPHPRQMKGDFIVV